jgi:geranylgeranyl pyrophosphate synthase
MKFEQFLSQQKALISEGLSKFIRQQSVNSSTLGLDISQQLERFVTGGKLARGSLVFLGAGLGQEKVDDDKKLKLAMAVELTHSALLMQDDIMDQDTMRRGQKTIHVQDQLLGKSLDVNQPELYGQSLAMCTSDLLFFWSTHLLNELEIESKRKQRLIKFFYQNMVNTVWGQIDDVNMAVLDKDFERDEILQMYLYKTARYTLTNPLLSGAILAGIKHNRAEILEDFADNLGIVFQIRDDALTLFGDSTQIGKEVGNDIKEDKQTLHRQLLFSQATDQELEQLDQIFGQPELSQEELELVKELMEKYQIKSQVRMVMKQYLTRSKEAMTRLQLGPEAQNLLSGLVEFIINRHK